MIPENSRIEWFRIREFEGTGWIGGSSPVDPNPNSPDGRTKVRDEPTPLEVRLLDSKTRRLIDSQRSKPDGTWRFDGLRLGYPYAVEFVNQNGVYTDNNGQPYNSFVQDFIYAVPPEFENVSILRGYVGQHLVASLYPPDIFIEHVSSLLRSDWAFSDFKDFKWSPGNNADFTGESFNIFDQTLYLNGVNQYAFALDHDRFQFANNDFCIEAHINPESRGVTNGCWILSKDVSSSSARRDWRFYIDNGGYLGFSMVSSDGVDRFFTTDSPVPLNTWSHVAVCRDGGVMRLFINGSIESTMEVGDVHLRQTINQVCIGTNSQPQHGTYYHGSIAQIRITKAARYVDNFVSENIPFTT